MIKNFAITFAAFALVGACAVGAAMLAGSGNVGLHAIEDDSPCPATTCTNGECHGFGDVPEPDGAHELMCPETGCASVECHAWSSLVGRYHQASDASLNVWILLPVLLAVGLVALVRKA